MREATESIQRYLLRLVNDEVTAVRKMDMTVGGYGDEVDELLSVLGAVREGDFEATETNNSWIIKTTDHEVELDK